MQQEVTKITTNWIPIEGQDDRTDMSNEWESPSETLKDTPTDDFAKGKTLRFNPPKEWRKKSPSWEVRRNPQYIGFTSFIHYIDRFYQNKPDTSQYGAGWGVRPENKRRFCEIGSYMGESTHMIASSGLFDEIIAIDPHSGYEEYNDMSGRNWDNVKTEFAINTRYHRKELKYINKYSYEVGNGDLLFPDEYFDVTYIDAAHDYDSVLKDIHMFYRKTKYILSGHDFGQRFDGVHEALKTVFGETYLKKNLTLFEDSSWALLLDNGKLNKNGESNRIIKEH